MVRQWAVGGGRWAVGTVGAYIQRPLPQLPVASSVVVELSLPPAFAVKCWGRARIGFRATTRASDVTRLDVCTTLWCLRFTVHHTILGTYIVHGVPTVYQLSLQDRGAPRKTTSFITNPLLLAKRFMAASNWRSSLGFMARLTAVTQMQVLSTWHVCFISSSVSIANCAGNALSNCVTEQPLCRGPMQPSLPAMRVKRPPRPRPKFMTMPSLKYGQPRYIKPCR